MNATEGADLVAALRSGDFPECKTGRLASGVRTNEAGMEEPAEYEPGAVLCHLAIKAGVIVPPTRVVVLGDPVTWLYRGRKDDPPSCISIPRPVMDWSGLELEIGDAFTIRGQWRTWVGHVDNGVSHADFADALEADLAAASRRREQEDRVA